MIRCRFDNLLLSNIFMDLGHSPPSNSFVHSDNLLEPEVCYPLKVYVSERTFYVQVPEFKKAKEIFNQDYAYFSSYSKSWLAHCKNYVEHITEKLSLTSSSNVMEIASNDGYLLQYFREKNIPCYGIEPSKSVADAAKKNGIETYVEFFTESTSRKFSEKKGKADLVIGNNVFAHVPDVNDFICGLKLILASAGTVTLEFPHIMRLINENQFDTIYHEHFSYFSLYSVNKLVEAQALEVFDVEELPTHGGSLRIYLKHKEDASRQVSPSVLKLLNEEASAGLLDLNTYLNFAKKIEKTKLGFINFLIDKKMKGETVAAYGAAAKGNTLLNFCGIRSDLIPFVVDASTFKQGRFLPGSHIPIVNESVLKQTRPAYIVILPWNIKNEIVSQLSYARDWGAKFVVAIPELTIF